MSEAIKRSGSYGQVFWAGTLMVLVLAGLSAANVYTNIAPVIAESQRSMLFSGLVSILLVVAIALAFVITIVIRERAAAVETLAAQARRIEQGDFDIDLATNRTDDIGDISRVLAALRDSEQLDRQQEPPKEIVAQYCETVGQIANGSNDRRLDEDVDDPELSELAVQFNEVLNQREQEINGDSQ